jgi:hypothetical protein
MKQFFCVLSFILFSVIQGKSHTNHELNISYSSSENIIFPKGETAYIVFEATTPLERRVIGFLSSYLEQVLLKPVKIVSLLKNVPPKSPVIMIRKNYGGAYSKKDNHPESFMLQSNITNQRKMIVVEGLSEKGIKRAVQKLIIQSEQRSDGLCFKEMNMISTPWISKREWTLCPWAPDIVRRSFTNTNADKRNNIWLYGQTQLSAYVDMFDWFGFSGVQLMETVANYGILGSPASFQDRQKLLATAARKNGQDVTLWVWAAQFNDYGWKDPDVVYTPEKGVSAFEDAAVRSGFEKYYDLYSNLAPYVDMLIAHYYDPGMLKNKDDVFNYMKLLFEKFKNKNPKIDFGIDFWHAGSDSLFMNDLLKNGFKDALLLQSGMPHLYKDGKRESLHVSAKKAKVNMGVWGWYTTEYETDQMPSMYVNTKLIKKMYLDIKEGAHAIHPVTYWSEMDAYHLNNVFSMYSAAQLLWDPERDPDEILWEIVEGFWGPLNGKIILQALNLIQDIRSGETWDSYWWYREKYKPGMNLPEEDLKRANDVLYQIENMEIDKNFVPKFPLPFPPKVFLELMIPHVKQIRDFAHFRKNIKDIYKAFENGLEKSALETMAKQAWIPIPEYSTWIGNFGQPEAIMQENMMDDLRKDLGIKVETPAWIIYRDANRYLQRIKTLQRGSEYPIRFKPKSQSTLTGERTRSEFNWSEEKAIKCVNFLFKNGLLKLVGDDTYQLNDHIN